MVQMVYENFSRFYGLQDNATETELFITIASTTSNKFLTCSNLKRASFWLDIWECHSYLESSPEKKKKKNGN